MKRTIALLLVLGMMVFMTACGGGKDSPNVKEEQTKKTETAKGSTDESKEIVFWSMLGGADGELLDAMIAEYNATNPEYKVKHYVQDWGEYYNKLTFSVASKEAPDVCISHVTRLLQLADQKVIEPLDSITGADTIDWNNFLNGVDKTAQVDGVSYAIPLDFHGFLLYYNVDYLMDAGIISSKDETLKITGFDEFLEMLDKLKNLEINTNDSKEDDVYPLALQTDGDVPYKVWYTFYLQNGGTPLLSADGTQLTMDDAASELAVSALMKLYNGGYAGVFNNQWEDFKAGKAAFVISLTSDVASFHSALGDQMNVVSFPALFDNNKTFADSHSFIFPVSDKRSDEKEKAAIDFANWMVNSGKWMQTGHFPTTRTVFESSEYLELPFVASYKDAISNLTYMSGSKNCWLLSPPQTLQNFERIYAERSSMDPKDATVLIREGLDKDK